MLTFSILVYANKERRGRLVEWVEKASFDRLNKLFMIASKEQNHQTLLTARNLFAVIQEPRPYVLPIIPRRLPKVVVLGEYHVLKDLPFYEEAHGRTLRLAKNVLTRGKEKRQEGMLRKAPGEKG